MAKDFPAGVRYVRELGPGDSGVRVSLRRRLPDGPLGDVLGELERWADGVVVVRRSDGERVEVAEADVVAVKRVPPPPPRRQRRSRR